MHVDLPWGTGTDIATGKLPVSKEFIVLIVLSPNLQSSSQSLAKFKAFFPRHIFFSVKEEIRTRGHEVTLAKKQCSRDIKKISFSQRTVNEWNRLSADCVPASSVNIFKNKIDIYLRRAGYT